MKSTPNERIYRYELLDSALQLYKKYGLEDRLSGLCSCSRYSPLKAFGFSVLPDGSVVMEGLNKCHCRSSCPVCGYGEQISTMNEIQRGIWNARHMGFGVYLVTFTFRHGAGDDLSVIQSAFSEARQRLYRNHSYRDFMKSLGYLGRISDYEVQLCGINGFHPHSHELFIMDPDMDLQMVQDLTADYWLEALSSVGLSAKRDISVDVLGYRGVGDYITKMGAELCLGNYTKDSWDGSSSMSPFRCLAKYHDTQDDYFGVWWVDYVMNVRRKRMLGWSRGLKDRLNVHEFVEDVIEKDWAELEGHRRSILIIDDPDHLRRLAPWQWCTLREVMNRGDVQAVEDLLRKVRIPYYINSDGLRILNERVF